MMISLLAGLILRSQAFVPAHPRILLYVYTANAVRQRPSAVTHRKNGERWLDYRVHTGLIDTRLRMWMPRGGQRRPAPGRRLGAIVSCKFQKEELFHVYRIQYARWRVYPSRCSESRRPCANRWASRIECRTDRVQWHRPAADQHRTFRILDLVPESPGGSFAWTVRNRLQRRDVFLFSGNRDARDGRSQRTCRGDVRNGGHVERR